MFLLIDNYDSFTYNLVQAFYALGQDPVVVKNDDPRLLELAQDPSLNMVCLSPGPGHPKDAGYCMEVLRILDPKVPVLGVCLGHQALGLAAGAEVVVGPCIMHGKASEIVHDGSGLFSGVPNPMRVGRYHSLVVRSDVDEAHAKFTVTAHGPEGEIMALRYKDRPWVGVQFHPESILTPDGLRLLGNFPKAMELISQLDDLREPAARTLSILSGAFVDLYRGFAARQANVPAGRAAPELGYAKNREFAIKNGMSDSGAYTAGQLGAMLEALAEADLRVKSSGGDDRVVLEETVAKLFLIGGRQKC